MSSYATKNEHNTSHEGKQKNIVGTHAVSQGLDSASPLSSFKDNRPETINQLNLQDLANNYSSQKGMPFQQKERDTPAQNTQNPNSKNHQSSSQKKPTKKKVVSKKSPKANKKKSNKKPPASKTIKKPSVVTKHSGPTTASITAVVTNTPVQQVATADQKGISQTKKTATTTNKPGPFHTFNGFYSRSATAIASGSNTFGNQLTTSFRENRSFLSNSTPPTVASVTPKPKQVAKATLPLKPLTSKATLWAAPVPIKNALHPPQFQIGATSDPQQVSDQEHQSILSAQSSERTQMEAIHQLPGQEKVQGIPMHEYKTLVLPSSSNSVDTQSNAPMNQYLDLPIPGNVRSMVDGQLAPGIAQTVASPLDQVAQAKEKRDHMHSNAVLKMKKDTAALTLKANQDQETQLTKGRQLIEIHKEDGMQESRLKLQQFRKKLGGEKSKSYQNINAKIQKTNQDANQHIVDGHKKAKEKHKIAQQKIAKRNAEAAARRASMSWWDRIVNFFQGFFNAITHAISSIVSDLEKTVKSIISLAQHMANSLITACTQFIAKAIKIFASLAQNLVNTLLFAFPSIRKSLDAAINRVASQVTAAVNKIVATLKAGINKVAGALQQTVAFAANYMEIMVEAAAEMAGALLSGNFLAFPKIAFIMACKSIGLPGEQFYHILSKAGSQLIHIILKPASFLKNLIHAGAKGFHKFLNNIVSNIESGLMGWLFGQIAQAGITLPKTINDAAIFTLVRQALGFTFNYVKQRAINIIGAQNVERLEELIQDIKMLFNQGPLAVYEHFKDKFEQVKSTLIAQIENWAISKVIQKGVIKVTSMLIPGGGFVEAILGMWKTLQFFKQNITKIMAVVNTLMNSIGQIAKGNIATAANYVNTTLVKTLPLVFVWMAKLIGLGGIGSRIKTIMDTLRAPVNKMIDMLIHGLLKMGKGALGKVKSKLPGAGRRKENQAKERFLAVLQEKTAMTADEIQQELTKIKTSFHLHSATFEIEDAGKKAKIILAASQKKATSHYIELFEVNETQEPIQAKTKNTVHQSVINPILKGHPSTHKSLPDGLKRGMQHLSGMNLDHVRVYHNSNRPEQVNAHAYAQGHTIHLAPGQEHHLPHELAHITQQAQGKVRKTSSISGLPINDNSYLENEADQMGKQALAINDHILTSHLVQGKFKDSQKNIVSSDHSQIIQRAKTNVKFAKKAKKAIPKKAKTAPPKTVKERKMTVRNKIDSYTSGLISKKFIATGVEDGPREEAKKVASFLGDKWLGGHMINDQLGGHGGYSNIVPITYSMNGKHRTIENRANNALDDNSVQKIEYKMKIKKRVKAIYNSYTVNNLPISFQQVLYIYRAASKETINGPELTESPGKGVTHT